MVKLVYRFAIVSEYTSLGCWKDTEADRAIPTLEGNCTHLDIHFQKRSDAFQKCVKCAKERGMKIFALQNRGWCAGTVLDGTDYAKHGVGLNCPTAGLGANSINHVYRLNGIAGEKVG